MPNLDRRSQDGIRRYALTIADGVEGADALGLLAASCLVPHLGPLAANSPTAMGITLWLESVGGNALASWLKMWVRDGRSSAAWQQEDERSAVIALARGLTVQIASHQTVANTIANLLQHLEALPILLTELQRQHIDSDHLRALYTLHEGTQRASAHNQQLHDAVQDVIGQVRQLQPAPAPSTITVGGNVETVQSISITGGTIGDIIATQQNSAGKETPNRDITPVADPRLAALHRLLVEHYSESELRTLCFELGIDYSDLPAQGRADQARELVIYAARHGIIDALIEAGRRERHEIDWDNLQ